MVTRLTTRNEHKERVQGIATRIQDEEQHQDEHRKDNTMPRIASKDSLDSKIAKLEAAITKNREQYEKLTAELEELKHKKDALKNDELLKAIADSPRSFEDILQYIKGDDKEATEAAKGTSEPTTSE